ncbi:MAG: DUF4159 domain-containing protein [Acidobacteria bacterium]|nr:DUF4159 domain-containing protein [Acidobacteriota bacterium]
MRVTPLLVVGLAAVAAAAGAQDWWDRGWGGFRRVPPRFASAESFDGAFNFCRIMYQSGRREAGGQGWRTDYPDADVNFSIRLSELTKTRVSRQLSGEPNHLVVRLTDAALFQCPFAILEDAGTASLSDPEIANLRAYLVKGGFVWVDDFWGTRAWDSWVSELARVLPPAEYPIQNLPPDHPIFRTMFEVQAVPQIPSIQFWRMSGGGTSERGPESAEPDIRGISDRHRRLMVLMTHDTDIADAWEREGEDPRFFYSFSPDGYAVGINVLMYAMTH